MCMWQPSVSHYQASFSCFIDHVHFLLKPSMCMWQSECSYTKQASHVIFTTFSNAMMQVFSLASKLAGEHGALLFLDEVHVMHVSAVGFLRDCRFEFGGKSCCCAVLARDIHFACVLVVLCTVWREITQIIDRTFHLITKTCTYHTYTKVFDQSPTPSIYTHTSRKCTQSYLN